MASVRRVAVAMLAVAFVLVPAATARGSTSDDLDAARAKLADARANLNAAAAEFDAANTKLTQIQSRVGELQAAIDANKARAASLKSIASARALYAYEHTDANVDPIIGAQDATTALREQQLLQEANQTDNTAIAKLAALNADTREQQLELQRQQAEQQQLTDQLATKTHDLNATYADAQAAAAQLQAKLDQEIAAAAAAEKARLEAERAQLAASQPSSGGAPGQIIVNPGGGPFTCPVIGAAYRDDYGGPTGHPGIDMFVPIGTPAIAVKWGSVFYMANDGAGGNEAYVNADGNTYYYAHLSSFVGGARQVSQGELIGYTGMTGNATAPHLHFEIRIGGPNGSRIDPYPTLQSAGC